MNELTTTEMHEVTGGMSFENLPSLAPSASLAELLAAFAQQQQQARLRALERCFD